MKTLIISPYSPYPVVFGGAIRVYHVIKMFAALSEVTLVSYVSGSDIEGVAEHLRTICKNVHLIPGPPTEVKQKWLLQARGTFGLRTFQYYAMYSHAMQQVIDRVLQAEQFDCIVFEQSQMAYFNVQQPGAMRIVDLHNIEYELLERRVPVQKNPAKRAALALEAFKFRRDEKRIYREADLIFTPSERERNTLRELPGVRRVEALPNSIDTTFFAPRTHEPAGNEIIFVGTTHVDANRDGVNYFVNEIFPLIEARVPDIKLWIVGGNPPPEIRAYDQRPNITVTGFVDDVRTYMARAQAMIVPLRAGGGTRLKILESLSYGVPTVSTSIGAEGIDIAHNHDILLADDTQQFADEVVRLLSDAELRQRLSLNGRQLVEQRYSWQAVGRSLRSFLRDVPAAKPHETISTVTR